MNQKEILQNNRNQAILNNQSRVSILKHQKTHWVNISYF